MTWSSCVPQPIESNTLTTSSDAHVSEHGAKAISRSRDLSQTRQERTLNVRSDLSMDSLLDLPSDVIINVFNHLSISSLFRLSLTCRYLHDLISHFGWASYLRQNPRNSWSLSCIEQVWSPFERVRYNSISERNWKNQDFVARPLSAPWLGRLRPELAISRKRLVIAADCNLYVYTFSQRSERAGTPGIQLEGLYPLNGSNDQHQALHDITAIAFLPDNGEDRTLLIGFVDGYVMRVTLPDPKKSDPLLVPELEPLDIGEDSIMSISVSGNLSFSLSGFGKGTLRLGNGKIASEMDIGEKSWSSFLPSPGAQFVAIGASSKIPLAVYPIRDTGLSTVPSAALTSVRASEWASRAPASAVYGITGPPPSFPGNPEQIIVSGWFDGRVRLFDLRNPPTSSMTATPMAKAVPVLSPIMSLSDPWASESIYSVSSGGGTGCNIAAGTARHSVVAFWDIRAIRESWSVHAPGNDSSPVYAIQLESSRLYGATQSRAFVCDFGPGVDADTYPKLPQLTTTGRRNRRGLDDALRTEDGIRYKVTKYLHRNPMAGG
ncbi:hypothetical protein ACEPAI_9017 [Sanghuangporus weigelae]